MFTFADCDCDPYGSESLFCHKHTGQCECLKYIIGKKCTKCEEGKYDFENSQCQKDCECDMLGSVSKACTNFGDCTCKKNIVGDKCDQCKVEHWDFPTCKGIWIIKYYILSNT